MVVIEMMVAVSLTAVVMVMGFVVIAMVARNRGINLAFKIVICEPEDLAFMFSGGIKLDLDYTPAMLYQIAKMDGAIILSANASKIAWANVQLMPDPTIHSDETGTRHRTAERVAKQSDAIVLSISQRRQVVSLYIDASRYVMVGIPEQLAKANQALATLDKYRRRLDQVSARPVSYTHLTLPTNREV